MSLKVITFFALEALYFVMCHSGLEYHPDPSFTTVFFKVLPISYLIFIVATTKALDGEHSRYQSWVLLGLVFSLVGDVFMVWVQTLFEAGAFFFAIAHFFYIRAFRLRPLEYESAGIVYLSMLVIFMFFYPSLRTKLDIVVVVAYLGLIFTMWWRSIVRWQRETSFATLLASAGALVFLVSDFFLALDKWRMEVPYCALIVMVLYYFAQFAIAMSVYLHVPPGYDAELRSKKQG